MTIALTFQDLKFGHGLSSRKSDFEKKNLQKGNGLWMHSIVVERSQGADQQFLLLKKSASWKSDLLWFLWDHFEIMTIELAFENFERVIWSFAIVSGYSTKKKKVVLTQSSADSRWRLSKVGSKSFWYRRLR